MRLIILFLILTVLYCCVNTNNYKGKINYGVYSLYHSNIYLELFGNKTYNLHKTTSIVSFGCSISESENISLGYYEVKNDTLILSSSNNSIWKLIIKSKDKLEPFSFLDFTGKDVFWCTEINNKRNKWLVSQNWSNGKKCGIWLYNIGNGRHTHEIIYDCKTGMAIDSIFH